jgi:hypothetical protein
MGSEPFREEPEREDQLEEASWDEREHSGAVCHVDLVEHGQDASDQEDRVADDPEDGQASRHDPRRQQG